MTASEAAKYLGRKGVLRVSKNLDMPIVIHDVREVYGRLDVLVGPTEERYGVGRQWVSEGRVIWES